MGFNEVYRVLQELFPQVDARLLRAVAVDHSKDADEAVGAVVTEVIPFLSERTNATSSSNEIGMVLNLYDAVTDANTTIPSDDALLADPTCFDEALDGSSFSDANERHDGDNELVLSEKCNENCDKGLIVSSNVTSVALIPENGAESILLVGSDQNAHVLSKTSECGDDGVTGTQNSCLDHKMEDSNRTAVYDSDTAVQGEIQLEHSDTDRNLPETDNSIVEVVASAIQKSGQHAPESTLQLVPTRDMLIADVKQLESSDSLDTASKRDISTSEIVDLDCDSTLNKMVTRSGQICSTDLLEDIIENARSNKKTLFVAMESVISLMREMELQEKAAEEAKEEAAWGGLDILKRVEDLKHMLRNAKEANDMRAGEVYGEKAILATEVKELQSRLLSLSVARDKSLAILEEISQTLEVRLAEAKESRKEAEQERLEKEEFARNALNYQELIMEKVVQESKILKQEAEENSKLCEFLMDHGRVVDMLQGEMSVICQDVKLLKEKFDNRVPLSSSLSSSQTSCRLASSASHLMSTEIDQVMELADPFGTPKKSTPTSSIHGQLSSGEERARDDQSDAPNNNCPSSMHEQLLSGDDRVGDECNELGEGWELFDKLEFDM